MVLGTGRNHSRHLSPLEKQRKTTGLTSGQMQSGFSLPHLTSVQLSTPPVLIQFRAAGLSRLALGKGLPCAVSRAGLSGRDHSSPLEQRPVDQGGSTPQIDIACPGVRENGRTPSKEPPLSSSAVLSVTGSVWHSPELTLWTMWAEGSLCQPGVCCTTFTDCSHLSAARPVG